MGSSKMLTMRPKQRTSLAMAPPELQSRAMEYMPDLPLKETSTWVAIVFHTVEQLSDITSQQEFLWLKCHGKVTVRTLRHYYFTRQPLDEFQLKYLDFYPNETDTVASLAIQSPWNDGLIVLRAVAADMVDVINRDDDDEFVARSANKGNVHGFKPRGRNPRDAIDLEIEDDDRANDRVRNGFKRVPKGYIDNGDDEAHAIVINDESGSDTGDSASNRDLDTDSGSESEQFVLASSSAGFVDTAQLDRTDEEMRLPRDAVYNNGTHMPGQSGQMSATLPVSQPYSNPRQASLDPKGLYSNFPALFVCGSPICMRTFAIKPWTLVEDAMGLCTTCTQSKWQSWADSGVATHGMNSGLVRQMPAFIRSQIDRDFSQKVARSHFAFQDYDPDAPFDSPQAAMIAREGWSSGAQGVAISWPDPSIFDPVYPWRQKSAAGTLTKSQYPLQYEQKSLPPTLPGLSPPPNQSNVLRPSRNAHLSDERQPEPAQPMCINPQDLTAKDPVLHDSMQYNPGNSFMISETAIPWTMQQAQMAQPTNFAEPGLLSEPYRGPMAPPKPRNKMNVIDTRSDSITDGVGIRQNRSTTSIIVESKDPSFEDRVVHDNNIHHDMSREHLSRQATRHPNPHYSEYVDLAGADMDDLLTETSGRNGDDMDGFESFEPEMVTDDSDFQMEVDGDADESDYEL